MCLKAPFTWSLYTHDGSNSKTSSERDTTEQLIGPIDDVIATVTDLVVGTIDWFEACRRLEAYDGVQAVDQTVDPSVLKPATIEENH